MGPTVIFLLSIGLCLDWEIGAQIDTLPKPMLWAVTTPVVPKGENVTLMCQGRLGSETFQLWKDEDLEDEIYAWGELAEFILNNVDEERDARIYSCRYEQGSLWSEFSEPLSLVVMTEVFPKPSISISHTSTIFPGTTVTIWCQMTPMGFSQEYSFALLEAKSLEPLQRQSPGGTRADFTLQSVKAEDTGSYSCIYYKKTSPYRGSHPSQAVKLVVFGLLPKPTLWAHSGLVVDPGTNITLWCLRPKPSSLEEATFILKKAGTQKPIESRTSGETWTGFLLHSVRPEDTGSYSCSYRETRGPGRGSEPSDALELVVPGSLPRPFLTALPGLVVEPGTHVTLQCWQPPQSSLWRVTFILLKMGAPEPLQIQNPSGASVDFPLLSVRAQDAGNYSCVYQGRISPYRVSKSSEVLEIEVTGAPVQSHAVPTCPESKNDSIPKNYTVSNLIHVMLAALALLILGIILGETCNSWSKSEESSPKGTQKETRSLRIKNRNQERSRKEKTFSS